MSVVYHQSTLKTFLMCGLRYEFEYVQKMKRPSGSAATIGTCVDTAVSFNQAQKVTSGVDLPLSDVLDVLSQEFEARRTETAWTPEDDQGEAKDSAVAILKLHHEILAPKIRPATIQEKFVLETDAGYTLKGAIDIVEVNYRIRDTKTASRQKASSYIVERSFQPAMYDYAVRALHPGVEPAGFIFDIFTRPTVKCPAEYKPVEGKVTTLDHEWLFQSIGSVHKAIQAGVALPAPEGSWHCSEKWCPYWSLCKGRK